jgi:hypothetical protein
MKVGDIVTIKNQAGMLRLCIEKELDFRDVTRGIGDDKLPGFARPRLEYHEGTGWGGQLITLCDAVDKPPFYMYMLHLATDCDEKPKCYLGFCNDTEKDIFETVY